MERIVNSVAPIRICDLGGWTDTWFAGHGPKIQALRLPPKAGKDALFAGDWERFGQAMQDNTEAQAALHPDLVSPLARRAFTAAKRHGALGWKVNGAGGAGGSVTILAGRTPSRKRAMIRAIEALDPAIRHIPVYLSRFGLRVWQTR